MEVAAAVLGAVAVLVVLALLRMTGWCIADVLATQQQMLPAARVLWLVALVPLFFIAAPAYVLLGPGRHRFSSWMLVHF